MVDKYLVVNKTGVSVYDGTSAPLEHARRWPGFDQLIKKGKIPAGVVIESNRKPIKDKKRDMVGEHW